MAKTTGEGMSNIFGKNGLEAKVAGAAGHLLRFPKLPHLSRRGLLYAAVGTFAVAAVAYAAFRYAGVPLPPSQLRREDGQEQQYGQNGDGSGLPVIVAPTPVQPTVPPPVPTATGSPVPAGEQTPPHTATPPKPAYTATPPPTQQPPTPPPATATPPPTQQPPAVTPTPAGPSLEERAQSVIDKYRNDTTTVIKDYSTVKPVVDAVLQGSGLKYDNLTPQIWPDSRFGPWYCSGAVFFKFFKDEQECLNFLKNNPDVGLAATSGKFVIIREGQFYQVVTSALREIFFGMSHENYNVKSNRSREIAGNLGFSFARSKLVEMFGYDPHNSVADTPENRAKTAVTISGEEIDLLFRAAWLINEDKGYLDRSKPSAQLTAANALASFKFFVGLPNPDQYVTELAAKNDLQKDSAWVTKALQSRLNPNSQQSSFHRVVLKDNLFYLP